MVLVIDRLLLFGFVAILTRIDMEKMSFDAFKSLLKHDTGFRKEMSNEKDFIDMDNGVMRVHTKNLPKYLEKYMCKDADDLCNTMWYSYGVFCQVID